MWAYEKKLQYPVKIKNPNPLYAKIIVSQLGGPDGELGAALRYLNQRYTMPYGDIIGILTDVGISAKCQPIECDTVVISEIFTRKKPVFAHTKTGFSN